MILVTGGTGLVGSHLLYHLALNNDKIRAIFRTESSLNRVKNVFSYYTSDENVFSKIEWFQVDITDVPSMIPALINVKEVYHCAAFISFHPKDYREMRKVNIHGTAIIANLCIDAKVRKLCFVSSIAAIGEANSNQRFATEKSEWNKELDNSGYSITKFGAEMEVWRASQEGVDVVIVNPGVILGSGFWNSGSGKLFSQIYKGFKYYTEGTTGFISVKDVVQSMILLMNSDVKNERYILVSENRSYKAVLFAIAKAFGKKAPSIKIKPWQTSILWRISSVISLFTRKEPMLSKYSARSSHSISEYSSEKVQKVLGITFEPLENSITNICKNYPKT